MSVILKFENPFHVYLMQGFEKYVCKKLKLGHTKMLLDGPDWLSYLADCEISISCIFLQLLHQINVENIAKFGKNSFC
jgi:hypothetical protein